MKSFWSDKRVTVTGGAGFLGPAPGQAAGELRGEGLRPPPARLQPDDARRLPAVPAGAPLRRPVPRRGVLRRDRDQRQTEPAKLYYTQPRHGRQPDGGRPAGEGRQVRRHRHRVQLSRATSKGTSRKTTSGPAPATPAWSTTA